MSDASVFGGSSRNGSVVPDGNIITVGSGKMYSTISAAVAAAQDGDTVQVDAGVYTDDSALINKKIILEGVGGMVKLVVDNGYPLYHQAPIVVNTDATIVNFDISGSKIDDGLGGNGAGIRYHAGNLTLVNDSIHDNQDGIAAFPDQAGTGTVSIYDSEVYNNGNASGPNSGYVHGIYAGDIAGLYIENSYFHDTLVGHEIKSRAENTTIVASAVSSKDGTGSYLVDIPNGGNFDLETTTLIKGSNAQNPALISYGEEGNLHGGQRVNLSNLTILNNLTQHSAVMLQNNTGILSSITDSNAYGVNFPTSGANLTNDTMLSTEPALALSTPVNYSGVDWAWGDYSSGPLLGTPNSNNTPTSDNTPIGSFPPQNPSVPSGTTGQSNTQQPNGSGSGMAYRFFDKIHGTQFLTSNQDEIKTILATRPDLSMEGAAFATASDSDPTAGGVYRFFDTTYGTHFYTTNMDEVNTILSTRLDLTYEGSAFKEHLTAQAGDIAVYRFWESTNGTHFFTSNQDEIKNIQLSRPDLVPEGVAFWTPNTSS